MTAAVLNRMNATLLDATDSSRFVTLFLAFYDTSSRTLLYANAAHCPPVITRSEGATEALESTATVLGAIEEFEAEDRQTSLRARDRLVVYSDGLTDAMDADNKPFGSTRLVSLLGDSAEVGIERVVASVMQTVFEHQADQAQFDDMTILILEAE